MATLNISLPESMRSFVESQVAHGGYGTASEFVRELIRNAQKQAARDKLEAQLLEGLDTKSDTRADAGYWARKRNKLTHLAKAKKK